MQIKDSVYAVVLAAGKGTRMNSEKPKVATELNGKPLIHYVLDSIKQAGIEKIIVIVGYKKQEVIDICQPYTGIEFVEQTEQLGTGHALLMAENILKDFSGFLYVACGDVPMIHSTTITDLLTRTIDNQYPACVLSADLDDPSGYGRVVRNSNGQVKQIIEHKDAKPQQLAIKEINTGTYVFATPQIFEVLHTLGNQNAQGEYYLPDIFLKYQNEGLKCGAQKTNNQWECSGINSQQDLKNLQAYINKGKQNL